jgi:hypothetical protein
MAQGIRQQFGLAWNQAPSKELPCLRKEGARALDKRAWLPGIVMGLLGLAIGGLAVGAVMMQATGYIPPLKVVGDVEHSLTLKNINQAGRPERITFQATRYRAVRLAEVISAAEPVGKAARLYLIGDDGFTSTIAADGIADCYLSYTASNGWEAVNLYHPVNSNVKSLKEIIVVSDGSDRNFGLSVTSPTADLVRVTPGQMLSHNLLGYFYHEGDASVQHGGQTYESGVYTLRQVFRLDDLTPVKAGDRILVVDGSGASQLLDNGGYFEVKDNRIDYLLPDNQITVQDVRRVIIDPPTVKSSGE